MRITILDELVVSFILLLLLASTNSIAASPTLEQSKKEAEAKGHILFTTHDEIVAMAKKEGKLRVMTALNTPNYKRWSMHLSKSFLLSVTSMLRISGARMLTRGLF